MSMEVAQAFWLGRSSSQHFPSLSSRLAPRTNWTGAGVGVRQAVQGEGVLRVAQPMKDVQCWLLNMAWPAWSEHVSVEPLTS